MIINKQARPDIIKNRCNFIYPVPTVFLFPRSSCTYYCSCFISVWSVKCLCWLFWVSVELETLILTFKGQTANTGRTKKGEGGSSKDSSHWYTDMCFC